MSLPQPLLTLIESHACFCGVYERQDAIHGCVSATGPIVTQLQAACKDCLRFRVAAAKSLLPAGISQRDFADRLSEHMRTTRGYTWSTSGYHLPSGTLGFWLSAASYGNGLFLVHSDRVGNGTDPITALILAFTHNVARVADVFDDPTQVPPGSEVDPASYRAQRVYLDMSGVRGRVHRVDEILHAPWCSTKAKAGHRGVHLVEFLPLRQQTPVLAVVSPTESDRDAESAPAALQVGAVCPVCGARVQERPLLHGSYVGCLC